MIKIVKDLGKGIYDLVTGQLTEEHARYLYVLDYIETNIDKYSQLNIMQLKEILNDAVLDANLAEERKPQLFDYVLNLIKQLEN